MFDLSSLRNNPSWIIANANMAGRNPLEALQLSEAIQSRNIANQQNSVALQNQIAGKQALQGADLTKGLNPDVIAAVMKADPELGIKLQNAYIQQKQVDPLAGLGSGVAGQAAPTADDLYDNAPPAVKAKVDAYLDARVPFPNGMQSRDPITRAAITIAQMKDPTLDATTYKTRQDTRKSFTSGADAANIAALNTALPHLETLSKSFGDLKNSDYPLWNLVANAVAVQTGNKDVQAAKANVDTDAIAVAHELAKVFRSTGMSEGEIKDWQDKISSSATPEQSKAVIQSAVDLIDGRLAALGDKYTQGMGKPSDGIDLLSPKAQEIYRKIKGIEPEATHVGGTASNQIPDKSALEAEMRKRGLLK